MRWWTCSRAGGSCIGVGSGYLAHEFAGYDVDPAEKRDRFNENLAVVKRLLAGERVTAQGRFTKIDAVQLNVLPMQREVPRLCRGAAAEAAYLVGKQGHNILRALCLAPRFRRHRRDDRRVPAGPRRVRTPAGENSAVSSCTCMSPRATPRRGERGSAFQPLCRHPPLCEEVDL